ncbi:MAG: zinc-ribbon domain-containing protein, partial [Longimicrobiales bacterium]
MTVECPGCKTRFPVDHRKVPDGGVHARCSVCSEVFFVDVESPEAELAPTFIPEDEPIGIGVELPEAEVLEEETAPGEEVWEPGSADEPTEEEPEPVIEAPEAEEEEPEPVFEAPEAEEEEPEPAFEAPEAEEEEPEPVFEAPEAEEEEPEPVFEAPVAEEGEPEPVFEAPVAEEGEPEP